MGKRLWGAILFLVAAALGAEAQYYAVNGACTLGGQATVMQGMASSGTKPLRAGSATFNGTGVMASYPGCTVTVFQTGTNTPVLIYSTTTGGSRTNPFTGDLTDGSWVFFVAAGCYDVMISSGATQASTMPNAKTFPGVCAGAGGSGGGGGGTSGTQVMVNGTVAVPNQLNFTNTLLVPGGSSVVNFLMNGNTVGAYVTGGGGGGTLPTTPQYDLFASTGSGGAQASGLLGGAGFLRGQVFLATGDVTSAPAPFPLAPNASVEYFPTGASFGGLNIGATNGLAAYFSHSGRSSPGPGYGNGGVMLGGGNSTGTNYQVYVDCESAPSLGCDFKVPITVNGSSVGGGGGGGLPVIPAPNIFASNGSGGAVDSGVLAQAGFLRGYVLEATGTGTASPFVVPNGSVEYFPTGGYGIGGPNGLALHFSHSGISNGTSPGWGNGGIALGGGNASGVNYQIYLDCESAPLGCDFKVPVTVNGSSIGGGGGITGATANGGLVVSGTTLGMLTNCTTNQYLSWSGSAWVCTTLTAGGGGVSSINTVAGAFTFTGAGVSCSGTTCTFTGTGGGGSGTVSSGTATQFAWYAATGTTVSSNAHLTDSGTTITSTETVAAPGLNVTGTGGIAITGAGSTLPTPLANQGGIGIGPGNVPQFYSNGGAWTNMGSGGGGATLPTIPATNLYASNGSGGAQDSNVQAMPSVGGTGAVGTGYIKSGASLVGGTGGGSSPFTGSNASQEWYGAGGTVSGVTFPNGAALFMGHGASTAGATGNGGIALGGGSATPTSQIYLDCEVAGCDFKVPVTQNGSAIGGGGAGSGTVSPNAGSIGNLAYYPGIWAASRSYPLNLVIVDSNNNLQKVTTAGTSGATAPTWSTTTGNTTADGATLVWTMTGSSNGNTTVVPMSSPAGTIGAAISTTGSGINIGNGMLQFGNGLPTPDTSIARAAANLLVTGNGTTNTASAFIRAANSGYLTSDAAFGIAFGTTFPNSGQTWILHCVIPVTITGSGAATLSAGVQINFVPTAPSTFSMMYRSATGTPTTQSQTTLLSATGLTYLIAVSITDISQLPSTGATLYYDGTIRVPGGANNTFYTNISTNNGTGTMKVGSYCLLD